MWNAVLRDSKDKPYNGETPFENHSVNTWVHDYTKCWWECRLQKLSFIGGGEIQMERLLSNISTGSYKAKPHDPVIVLQIYPTTWKCMYTWKSAQGYQYKLYS